MPDSGMVRSARPRTRRRGSLELLCEIVETPEVRALLGEVGGSPATVRSRAEGFRPAVAEPADWHHRLTQRGGQPAAPLSLLLAIVRSADTDAYRLLEDVGVPTGRLRKILIERTRDHAETRERAPPRASASSSSRSQGVHEQGRAPPKRATRSPPARRSADVSRDAEDEVAPTAAASQASTTTELHSIVPSELPPLFGRDRELVVLADALGRHGPRAPLLVGEYGSGRTLVASHVAGLLERPLYRLVAHDYPEDADLRAHLDAVEREGGVVLLDDLDRVVGDQPPPFLGALARAWASSRPRVLTCVTHETRSRLESWLPGVLETLDQVVLEPLDRAALNEAVRTAAPRVLEAHGITLTRGTHLAELVRVADRFLVGMAMPGRALDLLDLACARAVRKGNAEVDQAAFTEIVVERTGLSVTRVQGSGDQEMLDLERSLAERVVGHQHAVTALCRLVRRNRAGFASGRPIASVLLLGPSGVGKTEIAKALAEALFERDDALLRLDMSEYAESHAVARVVGAPPGYVGFEAGGALSEPLLRQPHRVVLLDEIEKAHRDVHQLLLQVFDDGRLTDGRGRTVWFQHAVVVMTSNLGARLLENGAPDDEVLLAARDAFPVELWNRIEAPLVLRPLDHAEMIAVCRRLARRSSERLALERGLRYRLTDEATARLVHLAGDDPALGARPLRHLLGREVESRIADAILRGQVRAGEEVVVELRDHEIALRTGRREL